MYNNYKNESKNATNKGNFKGTHNENNCRFCGNHEETQKHIIEECDMLKEKLDHNMNYIEIF